MKRRNALFAALLAFILLCGVVCVATPAKAAFSDVPQGAWYAEAVNWCRERGIVNDGTAFRPEFVMTRAMVATALYRAAGSPLPTIAGANENLSIDVGWRNDFIDMADRASYIDAVGWCAVNQIITGYSDGTFRPDNPVTRQQFAAMLWRSAGSPAADTGTDYADEASISSYAKTAVDWARDAGVILGKDGNRFDPSGGATRAQAAVILYRYLTGTASPHTNQAGGKVLVAYFSATGGTKGIAGHVADILNADSYEITPAVPYTSADLNYNDRSTRATVEQNDTNARPEITGSIANIAQYQVVFLGYPIWWGQAPRIISTFLESYNFTGKTIIPFCTSGSSPIGTSASNLHLLASGADWQEGRRFPAGSSRDTVKQWVDSLNLPQDEETGTPDGTGMPKVYFTSDISPDGLVSVYEALNWTSTGKTAVKLSTGEPPNSNYLRPELIQKLVQSVNGTIVECNTAYGGSRASTAMHKQVAADHGYTAIADFDLMDEDGEKSLPLEGGVRLNRAIVGSHIDNYDSFLILSHFKGHAMAGFGGAIKNVAIGMSSASGKVYVHTAGTKTSGSIWYSDQDAWLEALPEMVKAVQEYVGAENIVYVNVMNRLSVDCDCDGNPAEPDMHDIGILASYDPVALDQACVDLVYAASDGSSLIARMERQHGIHALEHGEEIGLGSRTYELVRLDG